MVYKYIFSLIFIFFLSCSEIDRDNILDPKNPDSKTDKVLLLEAFVNTSDSLPSSIPYNQYALDAIETLKMDDNLSDKLIVVEYHRNVTNPVYDDILTFPEIENWYEQYTTKYDLEERSKGVPDIFINGAASRVQGASNSDVVENRLRIITTDLLLEDGEYTIEADINQNGNEISGKYRVAKLGKSSSEGTILRIIAVYDAEFTDGIDNAGHRTVSYFENNSIATISSGDYLEEDFQFIVDNDKVEKLIFVLIDNSGLNVLHAIEKEIL